MKTKNVKRSKIIKQEYQKQVKATKYNTINIHEILNCVFVGSKCTITIFLEKAKKKEMKNWCNLPDVFLKIEKPLFLPISTTDFVNPRSRRFCLSQAILIAPCVGIHLQKTQNLAKYLIKNVFNYRTGSARARDLKVNVLFNTPC